jgi:hypothetical protein
MVKVVRRWAKMASSKGASEVMAAPAVELVRVYVCVCVCVCVCVYVSCWASEVNKI